MDDELEMIKPIVQNGKRMVLLRINGIFSPAAARAFGFKVQTVAEMAQQQDIADELHARKGRTGSGAGMKIPHRVDGELAGTYEMMLASFSTGDRAGNKRLLGVLTVDAENTWRFGFRVVIHGKKREYSLLSRAIHIYDGGRFDA